MTKTVVTRIGIYGDTHLHSKNYGSHRNYAQESLGYYQKVINLAQANEVDCLVCLGDFAHGRFHNLEYRLAVEKELMKAAEFASNGHYCIKGNHDIATYGMTERDYYIQRGLFREPETLSFNGLNIYMSNYREEDTLTVDQGTRNIILAHNFFTFSGVSLPMYGEGVELDNFENWYGTELILSGHIHRSCSYKGYITKDGFAKETAVFNVGCPCRLSYEKNMQDCGNLIILEVYDTGEYNIEHHTFDLLPLTESFNLLDIETKEKLQNLKQADVSKIAENLDQHERFVGDPMDIINSLTDIKQEYKDKAIELLNAD